MASNLLTSKLFRQNLLGGLNGERALDLVGEMDQGVLSDVKRLGKSVLFVGKS